MAYIRYNPHKPGDRERAYGEFFLGFISFVGSVGCVIYYICSLVSLFKGHYSENMLYSAVLLVVMAVIDFFIVFSEVHGTGKKESAKEYFLFFFGGSIVLAGVIAIIVAINSLCYEGTGIFLLICSILSVLFDMLVIIIIYRKIDGYAPFSIKLLTNKHFSAEIKRALIQKTKPIVEKNINGFIPESKYIYCHKCGKKLPEDSGFCSSCGAKLK